MRVVVSKRVAGLGSCLLCLLRTWDYARRTDRALVIDWRHSEYLPDAAMNLFDVLFENRAEIAGVPIITGSALASYRFPEPFHPSGWNQRSIHEIPDRYFSADRLDDAYPDIQFPRTAQYALCTSGDDHAAPTVVFHHGLRDVGSGKARYSDMPSAALIADFFDGLTESAAVVSRADEFAARHFATRPVFGLHVRHGNGEFTKRSRNRLGKDPQMLVDRCLRTLATARGKAGERGTVFLCTDSVEVQDAFGRALPEAVSFPKQFRPPGDGPLHSGAPGVDAAISTLAEMVLLSRCDVLLHTTSQFTFYPQFNRSSAGHSPLELIEVDL